MKPTMVAVDDDRQVLSAVTRDLRAHYADRYRIIPADSPATALEATQALAKAGGRVALFLVDQRMPGMSGTEYLTQAREIFPDAKRVLLTAYADTDAAIDAINTVGLDHYLLKPWDPPEEHLYPVLDDLLEDWTANVPAPYDGIRVVGARWSPAAHELRDFLARNRVPYRFLDVERDAEARTDAERRAGGRTPLVVFPDGSHLVRPTTRELAERAGLHTTASDRLYDLVVVGAGPAGLAAGVYGASEGLHTALIEEHATGGQAGTSSRIENYLGFPQGISGGDLARRAADQARRLGAEIVTAVAAKSLSVEAATKTIGLSDGSELRSRAVLICTGMTTNQLALPDHDRFVGAGLYYGAAPSEAASYEGSRVCVVGGANSAGQAAVMLARHAEQVVMIVRGRSLEHRMSRYLVDQIAQIPNIEVLLESQVVGLGGDTRLESVRLERAGRTEPETLAAEGLFVFIGARPHSDFVKGLVATDRHGFILTGADLAGVTEPAPWPLERDPYLLETNLPGVFAAGDVRAGVVRRVASAVGQGAVAVSFVHQYLETV